MTSYTSMDFTLSPTLLGELQVTGNGVYVYAFAFDGNGSILGSTTMISDGSDGDFSLALTSATTPQVQGGNVVVVIQQTGTSAGHTITPLDVNDITSIGDVLDTTNAKTNNYRYDAIEFTLTNSGSDVSDLTNIVQFGAPMSLSVSYSALPTDTRSYAISGQTLGNSLITLSPAGSQDYPWSPIATPLDDQRETLALANNVTPNPLNVPTDWNTYAAGFEGIANDVYLASYFNGVSGGPPASLSYFQVNYDSAHSAFWLVPVDLPGVSTTNYSVEIPFSALTSNIYTQGGTLNVYTAMNGTLVQSYNTFTPNNAYGDIVKYFVAGFDAGFWGGSAHSANPLASGTIDLNKTWNWSANYAYEAINAPSGTNHFGYTNSIGTGTGTVGDPNRHMYYDPFAAQFFQNSNAYGYSYSDLISHGGGVNPGISVYDPGTGANVTSIGVTLFDLGETPTGYRTPTFNYVAPTGATYSPADTPTTTDQFLFDFSLAGKFAPVSGTPLAFRFYAPGDSQAGADGFVALSLPSDYTNIYTITGDPGAWTLTQNANSGAIGFFIINAPPMTSDGTTGWYQMVIGSGSAAETYNIYAHGTSSTVTSVVIDGGALAQLISGEPNQAKFSFAPGGSITYDPAYFASESAIPSQILTPPLIGSVTSGGTFAPFADLGALKHGDLAFSWSPHDGGNQVVGGNFVEINVASSSHPDWIITPIVAQSTIDGDWLTKMSAQFGNGDYSAFMEQFKFKDVMLDKPVAASTVPVDFTVNLDKLKLVAADHGTALGLDADGSATAGNWIHLDTLQSSLPNGTLLAFATDAAGNLVDRDGHTGSDVTLDDAVLAEFGLVKDDGGGLLFAGEHALYLPAGRELHFAVESNDHVIQPTPAVNVTGSDTLGVSVNGSGGSVQFTATVDNTLSANDVLAGAQRLAGEPWVYLTQGSTVQVEVAGSADNINTAHFVRIDVNQSTGAWSVGGVAYGNTDAFRAAVQANWDQGFALQDGHGTFHDAQAWEVGGKSGFYAPVLATQGGDIFVIGNANVDGHEHIRTFGANTFGFEDLRADQHSDFDYNDLVLKLWPI